MIDSSSHIDSTKNSLYPLSVTTFEWSSSLLCLLEKKIYQSLAFLYFRALFLPVATKRANLVVLVASKTATSPPADSHAKTSSNASSQTWKASDVIIPQNVHLFSYSHPLRIAVVKELVIPVQPFSAFLCPFNGPRNEYRMVIGKMGK